MCEKWRHQKDTKLKSAISMSKRDKSLAGRSANYAPLPRSALCMTARRAGHQALRLSPSPSEILQTVFLSLTSDLHRSIHHEPAKSSLPVSPSGKYQSLLS